jgi:hypothetical protein
MTIREKIIEVQEVNENVYTLFAESNTIDDITCVRFISTWSGAKQPDGEHKKFEMCLDKQSVERLKNFFNSL